MKFNLEKKDIDSALLSLSAVADKKGDTIAGFIYRNIFCRYMCPGETIIHYRGSEFCNKIVRKLFDTYKVKVGIISAGKPQGNGQAEVNIKTLKTRLKTLMYEKHYSLPSSSINFVKASTATIT